jgi:hypothetical protein
MANERDLHSVPLVNKDEVVVRPYGKQKSAGVPVSEDVFRDMLLNDESLFD